MSFKMVLLPPQHQLTERIRHDLAGIAEVVAPQDAESAREEIRDADAAFGTLTPELLAAATRLRWLQAPQAGPPPGYYFDALVEHPVEVTNFRGIFNDHVAIHAVALVLALARGLHVHARHQFERRWVPDRAGVVHLAEATALVVGVGGIGGSIARMCSDLGMRVLGTDARAQSDEHAQIHHPDELDDLLGEADFVILTVPHTPQTEGLIDARRLGLMKASSFLVNVGRGPTVKLDDLVEALEGGRIAGAGLDVFEVEPLPEDHALWTAPNVLITPHVGVAGPYIDDRRVEVVRDNARRFANGEPLRNVVDKRAWF